ncbi:MAG: hypothetical protein ABSG45_01520 [Nitrososphaerales archaeon]
MPKVEIQLDIGENHYDPMKFVESVQYSEEQGFKTAWLGDHIFPWYHSAGGSPFVWSILGVAMEWVWAVLGRECWTGPAEKLIA